MTDEVSPETAERTLAAASDQARRSFADVVQGMQGAATASSAAEPRLFFPEGIDLIYVKVEAGLTEKTKVVVELKIAGAKSGAGLVVEQTLQPEDVLE
jgi:hypothetical protein